MVVSEKYEVKHFHDMFHDSGSSLSRCTTPSVKLVRYLNLLIFTVMRAVCGRPVCGRGLMPQLLSFSAISIFSLPKCHPLSRNTLVKHFASYFLFTHDHLTKSWSSVVNSTVASYVLYLYIWNQHSVCCKVWNFRSNSLTFPEIM